MVNSFRRFTKPVAHGVVFLAFVSPWLEGNIGKNRESRPSNLTSTPVPENNSRITAEKQQNNSESTAVEHSAPKTALPISRLP